MEQYADVVLDLQGNAVQGASVQVLGGAGNAQDNYRTPVEIFDANGAAQQNPITTGQRGEFAFAVANGKYVVRALVNGTVYTTIGPLTFYDPADDVVRADTTARIAALTPAIDAIRNNTEQRSGERPMIIAHRGFDSSYPQNTLLAFSSAMHAGADALEMDISYSADGVAYVFHDDTVDALTTGTGYFTSLTSATIDTLRFDALVGTDYADEPIPRFADVLTWARREGVPLHVELKNANTDQQVEQFAQAIISAGMLGLASAQSGSMAYVTRFRAVHPRLNVGFITADPAAAIVDSLAALGNATVIQVHDVVVANPTYPAYCASKGVDLVVYTIPDTFYLNRAAKLGVTKFMCSRMARGNQ